jgi:hypothetical protein
VYIVRIGWNTLQATGDDSHASAGFWPSLDTS